MHRIDTSTALPGGHFTDGNPALGQPATRLNASWFESVQEELAAVIEHDGGTLNPAVNNQLLPKIQSLIDAAVSAASGDRRLPVGTIRHSASATPEAHELACQGQTVSRTTYAALFAKIGTTFGVGDGSTTFHLPDTRGRTLIGTGTGISLTTRSAGQLIGTEVHTLSLGEMPSHQHYYIQDGFSAASVSLHDTYIEYRTGTSSGVTDAAGGSLPHNNMQPSVVCYAFITYE